MVIHNSMIMVGGVLVLWFSYIDTEAPPRVEMLANIPNIIGEIL